jgi:hypothetical protein
MTPSFRAAHGEALLARHLGEFQRKLNGAKGKTYTTTPRHQRPRLVPVEMTGARSWVCLLTCLAAFRSLG